MAEAERLQPTEEVLKSRRNLIALSFVAIIILTINPATITIKDWGLEIGIANSIPVKSLLLSALIFQLFVYYSRFNVRDFSVMLNDRQLTLDKLLSRIEDLKNTVSKNSQNNGETDQESELLTPSARRSELNIIIRDVEESNIALEHIAMKILRYHFTTEVALPCYISAFSIYWCTLDIVRIYSSQFNVTALINMQPFPVAAFGIFGTYILNLIIRKS